MAFPFGGAAFAEGQQLREAAIGGAILGKSKQACTVAQIKAAPDDKTDPDLLCCMISADDAGEAVMVGDPDRLVAESGRGNHQLVRMRSPAQKREVGSDLQLCIHQDGAGSGKDAMD